jgi:hypothetical protein
MAHLWIISRAFWWDIDWFCCGLSAIFVVIPSPYRWLTWSPEFGTYEKAKHTVSARNQTRTAGRNMPPRTLGINIGFNFNPMTS